MSELQRAVWHWTGEWGDAEGPPVSLGHPILLPEMYGQILGMLLRFYFHKTEDLCVFENKKIMHWFLSYFLWVLSNLYRFEHFLLQIQTNSSYCRDQVYEAEHGVCQLCQFDAHALYKQIRWGIPCGCFILTPTLRWLIQCTRVILIPTSYTNILRELSPLCCLGTQRIYRKEWIFCTPVNLTNWIPNRKRL